MVRTQIQLTDEQLQALRQLSAATGRSQADLIRQGVELLAGTRKRPDRADQVNRALRVAGKFSSGSAEGSREHDRCLAEAWRR